MIDITTLGYKSAELFVLKDAHGADIVDGGVACKYKVKGPAARKHIDAWTDYQLELNGDASNDFMARARFLVAITERMDVGYGSMTGNDALMAMYSDPKTVFVAVQVFDNARNLDNFNP